MPKYHWIAILKYHFRNRDRDNQMLTQKEEWRACRTLSNAYAVLKKYRNIKWSYNKQTSE
jgi:hypothetical protein